MDDFRCTCLNERVDNDPTFIIGRRLQGKTTLLVKEASKTNGIIVCPTHNAADYTYHLAMDIGCPISVPITYDELRLYSAGRRNMNYYFDEYGVGLSWSFRRWIKDFEFNHVKTAIIDKCSIDSLNNVLSSLKVVDMSGKKLRLKIEVCEV